VEEWHILFLVFTLRDPLHHCQKIPSDKYGLVDSDDDSSLVVGTRKAPPVDSSIQTLMAKLFYKTPKRESDHPKLSTRMSSTKIPVVPAKSNSSTIVF